jgi:hypothetical protein
MGTNAMTTKTIAILAAAAFAALTLVPSTASARLTMGSSASTHQSQTLQTNAKVDVQKPIKPVKCHKYARGNGIGFVTWETVCD